MKVLGPAKYAAWKEGKFTLTDLVGRKYDPQWGWTRYEKSLTELIGAEEAKGYTRLALMGVAKNAGNYSVDDLVRIAGLGFRELSPSELSKVVKHVAEVGFDPKEQQRVTNIISGQMWNGKVLQKGDFIKPEIAHYLKHVTVSKEWPEGTNLEEYLQGLKNIVEDPNSDIFISKYNDAWQVGFVGKSGKWQGAKGNSFIFVEYKVKYGYWVTGFQPKDIETQVLNHKEREILKWIRKQNLK